MKKSASEYTRSDFPEGLPVLKSKRGSWYAPNNCGYTNDIVDAGFYDRDEALAECFDGDKNGSCDVYAIPLTVAIKESYLTTEKIDKLIERLTYLRGLL